MEEPLLPPCLCCPLFSPASYHSFGFILSAEFRTILNQLNAGLALFVVLGFHTVPKLFGFYKQKHCNSQHLCRCSCKSVSSKHKHSSVLQPSAPMTSPFSSDRSFVCTNTSSELKDFHFICQGNSGELHSEHKCCFYQSGISMHFPAFLRGISCHIENINSWEFLDNEHT